MSGIAPPGRAIFGCAPVGEPAHHLDYEKSGAAVIDEVRE
ncbi:hypothetical protein BURMUCF2_0934 [Burkholderia multivorans CF2]|nr:hypothetical protein BURMUCF2_0934 [Burkholderia multivorans CF2]